MRHEHVATLGSTEMPLTIRGHITFWARLNGPLTALGNRLGPEDQIKIMDAVHARVPMSTLDEQRELKLQNAKADERTWSALRDMSAAQAHDQETLSATAKAAAEHQRAAAAKAGAQAAEASERVERLERGDDVPGGLSKPVDFKKVLREAGWTTRDINDAVLLHEVVEALGEGVIPQIVKFQLKAGERAHRRVLRQMAWIASLGEKNPS